MEKMTIFDWIKVQAFKIVLVLLAVSVAGNVFLATWRGINITKQYVTNNHNEQSQYQGQMIIYGNIVQGSKVELKAILARDFKELQIELNKIPIQYFPQWNYNSNLNIYEITYYEFMKEVK